MTTSELQEVYDTLKQTHLVENIILPTTRYVFALESPHVEELKYGVPVAGRSGQSMTHIILDGELDLPLGRLLLSHQQGEVDHPLLGALGLMNACQIPMQPAAYPDNAQERFGDFLTLLETIRSRPASQTYRDERLNLVRELILSDLRRQLQQLTERELHIIPCGRVAQTFFSLAGVSGTAWDIHTGIPHPARNQWHRDEVVKQIRALLPAANPFRPRSGESRVMIFPDIPAGPQQPRHIHLTRALAGLFPICNNTGSVLSCYTL